VRHRVIILGANDDIHSVAVMRAIERRHPGFSATIVDPAAFPQILVLRIGPSGWTLMMGSEVIASEDVVSVWRRRRPAHRVDRAITDSTSRQFAISEAKAAFDFITLGSDYLVVNRPERDLLAHNKPYQLAIARDCGLLVPDYAITNDVAEFDRRLSEGSSIFKTLTPPGNSFGETRRVTQDLCGLRDTVALAPVIFQSLVERARDYRVTVIGDNMFVHEMIINSEVARGFVDWRLDVAVVSKDADLPQSIRAQLRQFMDRLGLEYGAIDLIQNPDGQIYFLEVNAQGQFLFNEADTGSPLSDAFASLLTVEAPARASLQRSAAFAMDTSGSA
jgi:glutathione synthase/RimK-type ligase-like ATP-grasp enzyme